MGFRQDNLKRIVHDHFGARSYIRVEGKAIVASEYFNELKNVYKALGGVLDSPPLRFGSWDMCANGFIIELDEERHFNRYRLATLRSNYYENEINYFNVVQYRHFCVEAEPKCLRAASWGKNWKNNSTEKQFIHSDEEGSLIRNGSSRWRQRAFYDFAKDLSSKVMNVPLLRISIYEQLGAKSFGEHLSSQRCDVERIIEGLESKIAMLELR